MCLGTLFLASSYITLPLPKPRPRSALVMFSFSWRNARNVSEWQAHCWFLDLPYLIEAWLQDAQTCCTKVWAPTFTQSAWGAATHKAPSLTFPLSSVSIKHLWYTRHITLTSLFHTFNMRRFRHLYFSAALGTTFCFSICSIMLNLTGPLPAHTCSLGLLTLPWNCCAPKPQNVSLILLYCTQPTRY